ncbi:hypothetical protein SANA_08570 [Gottschalkiaceae bacterium SANA]|nr:hypothetical protein SANA_08570 [Gottschalkiaceae bacterium SANA]
MGIFNQIVNAHSFELQETIYYYENRPLPFSEIWIHEPYQIALIIDHGLCEQPVCGATWSYQDYVKKQNEISEMYRWLRYDSKDTESLIHELEVLKSLMVVQHVERSVDPRRSHPQLIGRARYQKQLAEWRKEILQGNSMKVLVSL